MGDNEGLDDSNRIAAADDGGGGGDDDDDDDDDANRGEGSTDGSKTVSATQGMTIVQRLPLANFKAGMDEVDRAKVQRVVLDKTMGSKFMRRQEERSKETQARINRLKKSWAALSAAGKRVSQRQAEAISARVATQKDFSHIYAHVDLDAFFAAVEERDNPKLAGIPMAVGGLYMLSTANYEARKYGVRSAMPGYIARELCPHLKIVPSRMGEYKRTSDKFKDVLSDYDPSFS